MSRLFILSFIILSSCQLLVNAIGADCAKDNSCEVLCGNGVLEDEIEECDDGNLLNGDGCDATCLVECGNGIEEPGEICFEDPVFIDLEEVAAVPIAVVLGDFDQNGTLDIATANQANNSITTFFNNGQGMFPIQGQTALLDEQPSWLEVVDIDNNGTLDLLTSCNLNNVAGNDQANILLGDGKGSFPEILRKNVGAETKQIAVGDIDGDTDLDFLTADSFFNPFGPDTVSIIRQQDDNTFSDREVISGVGETPFSLALGDFDDDGRLDIVTANIDDASLSLLFQQQPGAQGNLNFLAPQFIPVGASPVSVISDDIDLDGDLDLVAANAGSNSITVRLNDGLGNFPFVSTIPVGTRPSMVLSRDINGDLSPEIFVINSDSDDLSILLNANDGSGTFLQQLQVPVGEFPVRFALGDLNNDLLLDIVTVHPSLNGIVVVLAAR